MLAWRRLLHYRLFGTELPLWLQDRRSLNMLSALAALVAVGALLSFGSCLVGPPVAMDAAGRGVFGADGSGDLSLGGPGPGSLDQDEGGQAGDRSLPWRSPPLSGPVSQDTSLEEGGLRASVAPDAAAYYEGEAALLVDSARQADAALMQALARRGLDSSSLALVASEIRRSPDGGDYPFLRLVIQPGRLEDEAGALFSAQRRAADAASFAAALRDGLRIWAPRARLSQEGNGLYFILVDSLVTHSIRYGRPESDTEGQTTREHQDDRPQPQTPDKAVLTIVIDDMGESMRAARVLAELPYPVTLSVWPHARYAAYCATLAREKGMQVFIHQPMEPYRPERRALEPGTLRVGAPRSELALALRGNMALVPYAVGLNNHQGSRFTADSAAVTLFCEELFKLRPDFMVVDSLTHDASLFYEQARQAGFAVRCRDLFLDDPDESREAVLKMLDQGLDLARKNGRALLIGHPRAGTLAALAAWQGYKAEDVLIKPALTP